jgi:hypothetical protein
MAKKVTSKKVATKASKLLKSKRTSPTTKSVAGSAFSQGAGGTTSLNRKSRKIIDKRDFVFDSILTLKI